ncbi:MAG: hypothetical protein ABWY93_17180 [Mycobacterium sp.]
MTTHDHIDTRYAPEAEQLRKPTVSPTPEADPSVQQFETSAPPTESTTSAGPTDGAVTNGDTGLTESTTGRALFADDELAGLRARWDTVQAGFVDDPRACVHQADGLVSDVVDQLTTGFTQARSRLEESWSRGEEPTTEDLRLALKGYREFFERLLTV